MKGEKKKQKNKKQMAKNNEMAPIRRGWEEKVAVARGGSKNQSSVG